MARAPRYRTCTALCFLVRALHAVGRVGMGPGVRTRKPSEQSTRPDPNGVGVSIVVPLYNEDESIELLHRNVCEVCDKLGIRYEIVFIDDGSCDQTLDRLRAIRAGDPRVRIIRFRKNYGQTAALAAGFAHARGHVVVSMDGDLQNDPRDIPRLLQKIAEGYDAVCGWRKNRRDGLLARRIPSLLANWLIRRLSGVPIHDSGCTLRAYRAEVVKRVALYGDLHRFIPAMSALTGARVAELVVTHHPRRYGQSKYGISRALKVGADLVAVRMLTGFASRPLIGFALLGAPALAAGMLTFIAAFLLAPGGITLPAVSFLSLALFGHLMVVGFLSETVLLTGESPPQRMLAPGTIRET